MQKVVTQTSFKRKKENQLKLLTFNFILIILKINDKSRSFNTTQKSLISKIKTTQFNSQDLYKYLAKMNPVESFNSYEVEQQPEHYNQQSHYGNKQGKSVEVDRLKKVIVSLIVFILIITVLVAYREFQSSQVVKDGQFYKEQLLSYQLDQFWKMTAQEIDKQQSDTEHKIINEGQHVISRKELGHNSWIFLHMVTGVFPQKINPVLVKKFNAFLVLFGQMFPCKLCANHFMQLLTAVGPFQGSTKLQLMTYLCNIHNIVNQKLGKPQHSCDKIFQQWNSCGCSGET